jgi:3-deoxy-D-manno-octulosonic acid kinase
MAWSIPPGFELISDPAKTGVTVVVACQERAALLSAGIERPEEAAARPEVEWVGRGRVRHPVIQAGGERWLLKAYRRGGLIARWNPDRYWGPGRFLRELATAVAATRAGVPAPEPVALVLHPAGWGGAYRAWQVVRYVPGASSLREILQPEAGSGNASGGNAPRPSVGASFRAAGEAVRRMHQAEIDHPDLNVGNILARALPDPAPGSSEGGAEAFIIDWDRARLRDRGSWNPHRNLLRLWRSAWKAARLARPPAVPDARALRAFLHGYFDQNRSGLRSLRQYVRPRRAFLFLHAALWEVSRLGKTA